MGIPYPKLIQVWRIGHLSKRILCFSLSIFWNKPQSLSSNRAFSINLRVASWLKLSEPWPDSVLNASFEVV
jgi:hypothetical protein